MNIVLIGGQGSGKGTQVPVITKYYKDMMYLTSGGISREIMSQDNELGNKVKKYVNSGKLVPDEIIMEAIKRKLENADLKKGVLFDGIPRNLLQAEDLDKILENRGEKINKAIYFEVPIDVLIERITGRRTCTKCKENYHIKFKPPKIHDICDLDGAPLLQRDDDKDSNAVRQRLEIFFNETSKVTDYYKQKNILYKINGNQSIEQVGQDIAKIFKI